MVSTAPPWVLPEQPRAAICRPCKILRNRASIVPPRVLSGRSKRSPRCGAAPASFWHSHQLRKRQPRRSARFICIPTTQVVIGRLNAASCPRHLQCILSLLAIVVQSTCTYITQSQDMTGFSCTSNIPKSCSTSEKRDETHSAHHRTKAHAKLTRHFPAAYWHCYGGSDN